MLAPTTCRPTWMAPATCSLRRSRARGGSRRPRLVAVGGSRRQSDHRWRGADPALVRPQVAAWYPETKAIAERAALAANSTLDLGVVVIRPAPGVGALATRNWSGASPRCVPHAGRLALVGGGAALVDTTYIDNADHGDRSQRSTPSLRVLRVRRNVHTSSPTANHALIRELVAGICAAAGVPVRTPRDVPLADGATESETVIERIWPRLDRSDEPPLTRFLADQLGTAHWFDPRPVRSRIWAGNAGCGRSTRV